MIHVRPMTEKDIPQVAVIEAELFTDPWSEAAFGDSLKQKEALFLVAEDETGEVVGYCGSYRALDEAEIVNVAICPSVQNRGYGRKMIEELLKLEISEGVGKFFLEVRLGNLAAQHVYEQAGFKKIGIRRRFYSQPVEDAVIMQKEIISSDK